MAMISEAKFVQIVEAIAPAAAKVFGLRYAGERQSKPDIKETVAKGMMRVDGRVLLFHLSWHASESMRQNKRTRSTAYDPGHVAKLHAAINVVGKCEELYFYTDQYRNNIIWGQVKIGRRKYCLTIARKALPEPLPERPKAPRVRMKGPNE